MPSIQGSQIWENRSHIERVVTSRGCGSKEEENLILSSTSQQPPYTFDDKKHTKSRLVGGEINDLDVDNQQNRRKASRSQNIYRRN